MGVTTERVGSAAVIVLDWPERRNALGPDEALEVTAALREAASPPEVCGLVLTGNGAFCAGGDLRGAVERSAMPEDERRRLVYGAFQGLVRALVDVPVATVAAVDGPAVGMGFDLALACDSRFVGPDGWCQQGWGRVGLVPGTGGELLLRRLAPSALWALLEDQPRLSGQDLYEAVLRTAPQLARRFIFVTGDDVRRGSQAFLSESRGITVRKPFALDELLAAVEEATHRG